MIYIIAAAAVAALYIMETVTGSREDAHPSRPWMK